MRPYRNSIERSVYLVWIKGKRAVRFLLRAIKPLTIVLRPEYDSALKMPQRLVVAGLFSVQVSLAAHGNRRVRLDQNGGTQLVLNFKEVLGAAIETVCPTESPLDVLIS